jgi:hypothetical protein
MLVVVVTIWTAQLTFVRRTCRGFQKTTPYEPSCPSEYVAVQTWYFISQVACARLATIAAQKIARNENRKW